MIDKLDAIGSQGLKDIESAPTLETLEQVRISVLGKKGALSEVLKGLGQASAEDRPKIGAAAPRPLLGRFVRWILRRKLARGLSAVRVVGLERLCAEAERHPLLLCANHTAFWDGPLVELLSAHARLETRVLMLASQLRNRAQWLRAQAATHPTAHR